MNETVKRRLLCRIVCYVRIYFIAEINRWDCEYENEINIGVHLNFCIQY